MFEKKVLVAGCGKSGISATKLLVDNKESVVLFDENKKNTLDKEKVWEKLIDVENKDNIEIYLGELNEELVKDISLMVISPGIPTDLPFVQMVREAGIPVWSEIELAYNYEKGVVAAITGTNGKTTTTTLVGEIMKAHNSNTFVVGNIGTPYTELADKTTENSVTVAEISSFQLETIVDFKPHVSAILNITPDHLDRHYTFDNYARCKLDISNNQTKNDYVVMNYDDPETVKYANSVSANVVFFSRLHKLEEGVYVEDGSIYIAHDNEVKKVLELKDIKILGSHNVENVLGAVAISYYMGVSVEVIEKICTEFQGVEHRIEYVRTVNGVDYYNDSKGTNPDAAIKAIQAMTKPTFLIGGGYDKHSSYDEWIESFDGKVKKLLLIGATADNIAKCAREHGFEDIEIMNSLDEVVEFCYKHTIPGDVVLLSPACASWGMFDNYEQRGNMFKEYVNKL